MVAVDVWRPGAGRVVVFLLPEAGHDLQIEFLATEWPSASKSFIEACSDCPLAHDMSFMMVTYQQASIYHSGISKSAPSSNHAFQTVAEIAFFCSNLKVTVDDCNCKEYPSA